MKPRLSGFIFFSYRFHQTYIFCTNVSETNTNTYIKTDLHANYCSRFHWGYIFRLKPTIFLEQNKNKDVQLTVCQYWETRGKLLMDTSQIWTKLHLLWDMNVILVSILINLMMWTQDYNLSRGQESINYCQFILLYFFHKNSLSILHFKQHWIAEKIIFDILHASNSIKLAIISNTK